MEKEEEQLKEQRKRFAINPVDRECPNCEGMTLERETMGYEEVVFCTRCSYSESKTL